MKYVEERGEDWNAIGKLLRRTADNVHDKYKFMGKGKPRKNHDWLLR